MKKEIKKLSRQEREQIDNRLLAVFATALGSVMILLYLMNWFSGSGGFVLTARILIYVLMAGFAAGTIFLAIKSKKLIKQGQEERAAKYRNWKLVTIAGIAASFLIYPTEIISLIRFIGLGVVSSTINSTINRFNLWTGNPISTRIVIIMTLIAVFTLGMFVYYGVYIRKAHKASLNKGKKKA